MRWAEIALTILATIGTVWSVLVAYKTVLSVLGFFATKKFAPTGEKRKYGICVAARNEDKVILNFLESVRR